MPRRTPALYIGLLCLAAGGTSTARAETLLLPAAADATLYEVAVGDMETANSRGEHLFAGRIATSERRRALLRFDLSAVPAGATITSAQLSLSLTRDPPNGTPITMRLVPVTAAWSEGPTDAGSPGGNGVLASAGDPTWTQRAFPATPWLAPGGDFVDVASASTQVNTVARYQWGPGAGMTAQIQAWLDQPAINRGWLLIADEAAGNTTARRFASRESATPADRPELRIEYTGGVPLPQAPSGIPALSAWAAALLVLVLMLTRRRT